MNMLSKNDQRNFDRLGIDVDSSQIMILKAVMAASGGPSKFVTYKEVTEHLQKIEKRKFTKAYIYRQLSDLNQEGYLVIDSVSKPRRYAISESGIVNAFEDKRKEALSELEVKREEISTRLNLIKSVNSESFAFIVFNQLQGLELAEDSIIIEGIENVRNSVVREFGKVAKPDDEIRVIAPATLLDGGLDEAGTAEMSLVVKAAEGVKIIGLMIPKGEQSFTMDLIIKFMQNIGKAFANIAASGNISLRLAKENIKTYRMVSLNREKMLLYLTHAPESNMAALIHRKDNPRLIDDAVDTFDKIYDEGLDIMELVQQMLTAKQ
jgi:Fe2+ or Zn2+ uptake regulation protein